MSNYEVDPNIKLILDLKINKGVFPLTVDSAVIAHSPNGETTYLDSVVDYLYQLVANKLRLYTELDGAYTKGKAYPATMGVQNANNINALLGTVNNYASILSALQQQINNMDPTDDITSINNTILRLWGILNSLSEASEYSYQEIKFSDSLTVPPSDLDNTTYWKARPLDNPQHLWLGIRTITITRGEDGRPIITKGDTMVVSLQGPKGERGEKGERGADGTTGSAGTPGKSYRPVLMYKWTESRTSAPATPTDPRNLGWTESPNNPVGENKYLWMTLNHLDVSNNTYINPTWSTPVCLSGEDGVGSDGKGVEFIYFLSSSPNIPSVESLNRYYYNEDPRFQQDDFPFGEDGVPIISTDGWTDNPTGITLEYQYEYASFREGSAGNWKPFSDPFLWSRWGENGIDGDGVEYIYFTSTGEKEWPESVSYTDPMSDDPRAWTNLDRFQDDDFIPTLLLNEWFDEPQELDPIYTHQYVSMRKKTKVGKVKKWGAYTMPKLWNLYSGAGDRYVMLYQWTAVRLSPELPTSHGLGNWAESPGNSNNLYLWMIGGYAKAEDNYDSGYTTVSLWSSPVCLSGKDGVGTDGTGIEFIFFRTNDINTSPSVAEMNAYKDGSEQLQQLFQYEDFPFIDGDNIFHNGWTDNPQGITQDQKYEWASFRQSSGGRWDYFCTPFRWSMWGEDGVDGDGVEYIYYRCNNGNRWTGVTQSEDPVLPKALPSDSNFQSDDPADPRTWSNDPDFQNPEFIKDGLEWDGLPNTLGWSDDPRGVTESNMYEYVSSRKKEPDPNNPRKKIWGEYSQPVLWAKFGKNGRDGAPGSAAKQGLSGPVVRFRGAYDSSIPGTDNPYINSSLNTDLPPTAIRYIDVVYVDANGQKTYYMVKPQEGGTRRPTTAPTSSSEDWEEAVGYSFIAAEALYAHNAHIDNLSGYEFVVLDNNLTNYIVAGMTGGNVVNSVVNSNYLDNPVRIWAGSRAREDIDLQGENIPFKVFQDGRLKATNAEIKGDLSLDSLSLTGNEGSYYYNKESITLPQVDTDKHTVIFIITTFNATKVSPHSRDVLFALSNNNITTTNSEVSLNKYKIYLAISIKDGANSGWLILDLNSIEIPSQTYYYSKDIINRNEGEALPSWTVVADSHDDQAFIPLQGTNQLLCTFSTSTDIASTSITDTRKFTISGSLLFSVPGRDDLSAKLTLKEVDITDLDSTFTDTHLNLDGSIDGKITVQNIINIYLLHMTLLVLDTGGLITKLDSTIWIKPTLFSIGESTSVTVRPYIMLVESFHYTSSTNHVAPTTTNTVSSNGFVIKDGSIVATDMPEGATVNMKDCIVYKDVTETAGNEQYEVVNFGVSNVTIGNITVNPNEPTVIKAKPNVHIDFSDITAIDASGIIDPAEQGDPVNH